MKPLRIGSVCTGYGGLDMAVTAVFDAELVWVADNDPGAARILAHRLPGVPNLGDITAVDWRNVEPVDVLCGGYPCQPFSSAGKRKGTADARHIWPHIDRALRVLRPRVGIFENVAGHLSLGFDTVLADLAAGGFDAEWCTVQASDIGAAHRRRRLFLLASPADSDGAGRQRPRLRGRSAECGGAVADALDLGGHRHRTHGPGRDEPAPHGLAAADAGGGGRQGREAGHSGPSAQFLADVDGSGVRRGTAADPAGRGQRDTRAQGVGGVPAAAVGGDPAVAADPESVGRGQGRPEPTRQQGGPDVAVGGAQDWGRYAPAVERWQAVIGRPAPRAVDPLGRLTPALVEWLMGLPEGHVTGVPGLSRTAQLKALGNGVVPAQAVAALRTLLARTGRDGSGVAA